MKTNGSNALSEPVEWYNNPNRKCLGDIRFTQLPSGPRAKIEIQELIYLCFKCPVIRQCYDEALSLSEGRYRTKDVVQGGELWR